MNDPRIIKKEFNAFVNRLESTEDIENVGAWVRLLMDIFDIKNENL